MAIARIFVLPHVLLGAGCSAPSTAGQSDCVSIPKTAVEAGSVVTQGVTFQGKTPQGRTDQGNVNQGNVNQGNVNQGNVNQGNVNQGNVNQGTRAQAANARGIVLLEMNRATVRWAGNPVRLERGRLVAEGLSAGADLSLETPDGPIAVHIDAIEDVASFTSYGLSVAGQPVCLNAERGVFIEGGWDSRGSSIHRPGTVTYSCMSGVIAKCVAWGYAPWDVGTDTHQACTRLARADYCGTGESWTREGTTINLYDGLGIQVSEPSSELSFEAGWGSGGAVCVNLPRYVVQGRNGSPLMPSCWGRLPRCGSSEEARAIGATLFNDSAHLPACGTFSEDAPP